MYLEASAVLTLVSRAMGGEPRTSYSSLAPAWINAVTSRPFWGIGEDFLPSLVG